MSFLAIFGKKKLQQAQRGLKDMLVNLDLETATEAEIATIEEEFDKFNIEHSRLKAEYIKEQKEADAIVALYNKRLAGAEVLQAKIEADPSDAASTAGLEQLMVLLEEMLPDIEREKEEAADAKEAVDESQELVDLYGQKLKGARKAVTSAAKSLESAKRKEATAKAKEERSAALAGLRDTTSDMSSALSSMERLAAEANANADASSRKAKLLAKTNVDDNEAVAAAIAEASGETPKSAMSMSERLAALKPASA